MLLRTDETSNTGGVAHNVPGMFIDDHVDEDISREDLTWDDLFLAVLDLDLIFNRYDHIEDHVAHVGRVDQALKIGLDLILIARIRVDDVPGSARVSLSEIHLVFFCLAYLTQLTLK